MKLFKDSNGKVYAYDDDALALGYGAGLTPLTTQEAADHVARNSPEEIADEQP